MYHYQPIKEKLFDIILLDDINNKSKIISAIEKNNDDMESIYLKFNKEVESVALEAFRGLYYSNPILVNLITIYCLQTFLYNLALQDIIIPEKLRYHRYNFPARKELLKQYKEDLRDFRNKYKTINDIENAFVVFVNDDYFKTIKRIHNKIFNNIVITYLNTVQSKTLDEYKTINIYGDNSTNNMINNPYRFFHQVNTVKPLSKTYIEYIMNLMDKYYIGFDELCGIIYSESYLNGVKNTYMLKGYDYHTESYNFVTDKVTSLPLNLLLNTYDDRAILSMIYPFMNVIFVEFINRDNQKFLYYSDILSSEYKYLLIAINDNVPYEQLIRHNYNSIPIITYKKRKQYVYDIETIHNYIKNNQSKYYGNIDDLLVEFRYYNVINNCDLRFDMINNIKLLYTFDIDDNRETYSNLLNFSSRPIIQVSGMDVP